MNEFEEIIQWTIFASKHEGVMRFATSFKCVLAKTISDHSSPLQRIIYGGSNLNHFFNLYRRNRWFTQNIIRAIRFSGIISSIIRLEISLELIRVGNITAENLLEIPSWKSSILITNRWLKLKKKRQPPCINTSRGYSSYFPFIDVFGNH